LIAACLLGAWAAGLVAAAVQLHAWNEGLVRTLLQIRADAVFRTRMAEGREAIPREWYRSKTLALLEASEKLHDDGIWAAFVPGSWSRFDDLRPRVAARIERAFSDIAVETVRRELHFKAGELTGVPFDSRTGELQAGRDCAPAQPQGILDGTAPRQPQEHPESIAVQNQLASLELLDQAVQAMLALQSPGNADPENLRMLVRYTLGVELPGRLSRGAALFRTGGKSEDLAFANTGVPRLQWAARCSIAKAMKALDTRLFDRNDLIASETLLAQRAQRLLAPNAKPAPFAEGVEGYREIIAALGEQQALLATGDYDWLQGTGNSQLGPAHDRLVERVARIGLLGPEAAGQVRSQSHAAAQRFRRQFARLFAAGDGAALVWHADAGRLALSPQRIALRDALAALLQEPFMASPGAEHALPVAAAAPLAWDIQRLERDLVAVADERRRFLEEDLPRFPPVTRPAITQFVQAHLAQRVQDAAMQALRPQDTAGATPFDPVAYRAQRDELAKVQALLTQLGARNRAEQLRALLSGDIVERLGRVEQALWRSPVYSDRMQRFDWWQGEGSPILQAFGVADAVTLRYLLSQQLGAFDEVGGQAAALLAVADASAAGSAAAQRWQGMLAELKRYRGGAGDGSLAGLQRYLLSLADLNRSNCAEKLAASPAPTTSDEFAARQLQIHNALASRCAELRSPARPADPAPAAVPFG
jgi:type VI secretion system protein ImpL